MHIEQVEVYSDQTNAVVMRHPGRRFPGLLIQGDTLYALCRQADAACAKARSQLEPEPYQELNELRNTLQRFLSHYKAVLQEHELPLPFNEIPSSTG